MSIRTRLTCVAGHGTIPGMDSGESDVATVQDMESKRHRDDTWLLGTSVRQEAETPHPVWVNPIIGKRLTTIGKERTMNQPTSPQALSSSDFRSILGMNELADLGTKLFDPSHITAVQGSVQKSLEHTCDLSVYAKSELPVAVKCFSQNGASAFDHGTIQDLKHHKVAHETYLLLRGRLRILWKRPRDAHFTRAIRLSSRKPWAIIPAKHCLLVAGNNGGEFLAVAFKTKPSNQKNKGKQLGAACTWAKRCGMAKHCELLCKNRSDFFDTIKDEREKAVGRVQAFV